MAFFQASGVVSATPTTVLFTQLTTMLTDHPAWEFVEEYTEGTSTLTVWKCLGTVNGTGIDFFVCFARTTSSLGTSSISIRLAETFDTATNQVTKYSPPTNSTHTISAIDGSISTAASLWTGTNVGATVVVTTRTTTFNYMIRVDNGYIAIYASPMGYIGYAGLFESYWGTAYPGSDFPLILAQVGGAETLGASYTRNPAPGFAGLSTGRAFSGGAPALDVTRKFGAINTAGTLDPLSNTLAAGSRFLCTDYSGTASPTRARGVLPSKFLHFNTVAGVVETDTITVDGETFVLCSGGNGQVGHFMSTAA